MYIYLAPLEDKTSFKIGKSIFPEDRILQLQHYYQFDMNDIWIINCNTTNDSYRAECVLHHFCERHRIILKHDGGTEFFSYTLWDEFLKMVNIFVKFNNFKLTKLSNPSKIKVPNCDETQKLFNDIGYKIQCKRLSYNITQGELGKMCGVSRRCIQKIETGNGHYIIGNFIKILQALDLDYILSDFEVDVPLF